MGPAKPVKTSQTAASPEVTLNKRDLVTKISAEVKSVLQTPEILKSIVDSIIVSVTKVVAENLQESLKFNLEEVHDLKEEIKRKDQDIATLNEKIVELEQYQRRENIRIFGLRETSGENTDTVALQLFKDRLGITLDENDISRSHRIGPKVGGKTRPIIVRFSSYRTRARIFNSKRKLKGTSITIKEDLCHSRLQLLNAAIDKFGFRQVYSQDGKIVVVENGVKHFITTKSQLAEV